MTTAKSPTARALPLTSAPSINVWSPTFHKPAPSARVDGSAETLVYDLAGNGKSKILKTSGGVKVIKAPDGPVVGMTLVGERVGELIGEAQLIYGWEAYPEDVAPLIHAHPTQTEAIGEAFLALAGKPLHVHG